MRPDTFIARLRTLSVLCCGLFFSGVIPAAETTGSAGADGDKQTSWYQIELIVFSNQRESSSDELFPDQALLYPAKMLTIGPARDEQLSPRNLDQLKALHALQQPSNTTTDVMGEEANFSEFLFDDPDLSSPGRSQPGLSDDLLEEDLMTGLVREKPPGLDAGIPDESTSEAEPDPVEIEAAIEAPADAQDRQQLNPDLLFQQAPEHQAYRTLPGKEFSLDALANRISRSPYYHLLYHAAWRQPVESMDRATPILLQAGDQYDEHSELDGFITISRARYLHIDTDLWFTIFSPRSGQASMVMPDNTLSYPLSDRQLLQQYPDINLFESRRNNYLPVQTYRMIQSRRMRSATLHYLDHPAFSMLIRVDRFSFPESDSPTGTPAQPRLSQQP